MRLLIVSDAWEPQVNGVVRTLTHLRDGLQSRGWTVSVIGPAGPTLPCPTYPEIRISLAPVRLIENAIMEGAPDFIHIATEGPLGWAMRALCIANDWPFTTSFHTRFPEYLNQRLRIPLGWTNKVLRHFHNASERIMVPSHSMREELERLGFSRTVIWGRGVDTAIFSPKNPVVFPFARPLQLFVGRLAVEKNLEAFLEIKNGGTKIVVGDGPERRRLQRQFPEAVFLGKKSGAELASIYAAADVFVFPSHTDTFGLVLLEALACGVPVAAYPATGPKDVLSDQKVATLHENLAYAIERSLTLHRGSCRAFAEKHSWEQSVNTFVSHLIKVPSPVPKTKIRQHAFPAFSFLNQSLKQS